MRISEPRIPGPWPRILSPEPESLAPAGDRSRAPGPWPLPGSPARRPPVCPWPALAMLARCLLRGRGLHYYTGRDSDLPASREPLPVFRQCLGPIRPVFAGFPACFRRPAADCAVFLMFSSRHTGCSL